MAWFAAAAPLIASVGGTAVSAGVAIQQMRNAKAVGEQNARATEAAAKADADQTAREEEALRRQQTSFFGKQRAAIAEAGLGFGGTTGMLADQNAVLGELDALNLRYQGAVRGVGLLSQAAGSRTSGRNAAAGYGLMAGAQLLNGAGDSYKQYKLAQE